MSKQKLTHVPVLSREVADLLGPKTGESYLDLTAGAGGHAGAILQLTKSPAKATLIDRDPQAIKALRSKFKDANIVQSDFRSACEELFSQKKQFDMILADLGVSSLHLNQELRGFSFALSGPLDMRMDTTAHLTASDIVNSWSEADLADILRRYGQERKSRAIAKSIVASRPINTTGQLADIVVRTYRFRGKIHPATRTFLALRIVVNDELNQLAHSLPKVLELLAPGGRAGIISFHSGEDRLVKQAFKDAAGQGYDAKFQLLTKKPITPGPGEIVLNPRARSAKLRAVAKIKNTHRNFKKILAGKGKD